MKDPAGINTNLMPRVLVKAGEAFEIADTKGFRAPGVSDRQNTLFTITFPSFSYWGQ